MKTISGNKGGGDQTPPERTPDTLRSRDVVELIMAVSEGEISGLHGGTAQSFMVGDTPLLNSSGELNFTDFELLFYPGSGVNEKIRPALGGVSSSTQVGVELANNTPLVRTGQQENIDFLELRLVINQLYKQTENGGYTENTLSLLVEYKPTGASDSNWARAYWRSDNSTPSNIGIPGQNFIRYSGAGVDPASPESGQNLAEREINNGTESAGAPAAPDLNDLWIDTSGSAKVIKQYNGTNWQTLATQPTAGQDFSFSYKGAHTVEFIDAPTRSTQGATPQRGEAGRPTTLAAFNGEAMFYDEQAFRSFRPPPGGGAANGANVTIRGKTTSPYVKEIRWPVENINDTYDIRITKLSPDPGQGGDTENFIVVSAESFQEVKAGDVEFDNTACVQLVAQATDQFNGVPAMSGIWDGMLIRVPSNYDPVARTYDGLWDGTWKMAWSNNPAYIWNEVQLNDLWGRSAYYPVIPNKWDVYEAGQYCDEMVDDGQGGTHPRWTFNQWVTDPQGVKKFSRYLASSFNATYKDDGNGGVFLRVDKDAPAVGILTPEDAHDHEISYARSSIDTRVNDVTMTFKNPDLNYNEDRVRVIDQAHIDRHGRHPVDLIAIGCRNRQEALRRARARLVSSLTEVTTATLTTTRKGLFYNLWDVVLISDPKLGTGQTGRVKEYLNANKTRWVLRDPLTLEAGVDYFVSVQVPNPNYPTSGSPTKTERYPLAFGHPRGAVTELELYGNPLDLPEKASFAIEADGYLGVPKPFRVVGFDQEDGDPDTVQVTLMEVNREKYDFIDNGGAIGVIEYTALNPGEIAPPDSITFHTEERRINGKDRRVIDISWERSKSRFASRYLIEYSRNGGAFQILADTEDLSVEFIEPPTGDFVFRFRSVSITGKKSNPVTRTYSLIGDYTPVTAPTGLSVKGGPDSNTFASRDATIVWG